MYCSRCGQALQPGQGICPQCGLGAMPATQTIPGLGLEVQAHSCKVRALAICWWVFAGLSVVLGIAKLSFARMFLGGPMGPWFHPHHEWGMQLPFLLHIAWVTIVFRAALALAAGWGLWERTEWGRILAIIAACLCLLKFPLGTALGIWTLVLLVGYRNRTLYEQQTRG